mmetsp:Transcript_20986/g.85549  ORF Transcript_20986/g.85549 Transcript_20986/m.85549 type:complete len:207 (-) Transcript_20986:2901-3521(-)
MRICLSLGVSVIAKNSTWSRARSYCVVYSPWLWLIMSQSGIRARLSPPVEVGTIFCRVMTTLTAHRNSSKVNWVGGMLGRAPDFTTLYKWQYCLAWPLTLLVALSSTGEPFKATISSGVNHNGVENSCGRMSRYGAKLDWEPSRRSRSTHMDSARLSILLSRMSVWKRCAMSAFFRAMSAVIIICLGTWISFSPSRISRSATSPTP